MSETAIHLVDQVLPVKPIRQWVLSFPFQLRLLLAIRPKLMGQCLHITNECIATYLGKKVGLAKSKAKTGSVTLIQRFGGSINLNVHFHQLFIDGIYELDDNLEPTTFRIVAPPTIAELNHVLDRIISRITKLLEKQGLITKDQDMQIEISDEDSFSNCKPAASATASPPAPIKAKKPSP